MTRGEALRTKGYEAKSFELKVIIKSFIKGKSSPLQSYRNLYI